MAQKFSSNYAYVISHLKLNNVLIIQIFRFDRLREATTLLLNNLAE